MMTSITNAVEAIRNNISRDMIFNAPFSLISAKGGSILFYASLYRCSKRAEDLDLANDILEDSMNRIENQPSDFTLAGGYTGLGWLIQYLDNNQLINIDDGYLDDLDEIITEQSDMDYSQRNHDLLYGLIGKGIYFLERLPRNTAKKSLVKIVDLLEALSIKEEQGYIYWISGIEQTKTVNLGLAHGCASVISFLTKVHAKGIEVERIETLVTRSAKWLLERLPQSEKKIGSFPVHHGGEQARALAWCQGDLGILKALIDADRVAGSLIQTSVIDSLVKNISQKDIFNSDIDTKDGKTDSTFCHGTSGALHLINRIDRQQIKTSKKYWIDETIKSLENNRITGLSSTGSLFYINEKSEWIEDHGLLYGSTGIGLTLLTLMDPSLKNWDSIFLTN